MIDDEQVRVDALAAMCHFLEDIATSARGIEDDARLARPFVKYLVGPRDSALRNRTLDAMEVVQKKGREVGSAAEAVMGLHPCRPSYGAGETGRAVGSAAGGLAATAAISAAGAPMLAPVVAPIGQKLGGEAGAAVEVEASKQFKAMYGAGAMADYGAVFANRRSATGLAHKWQVQGQSSYVYFDPTRETKVPVFEKVVEWHKVKDPLTGLESEEPFEVMKQVGMKIERGGAWVVEAGEPTPAEDELIRQGKVAVVRNPEQVPTDPKHETVLLFPALPSFGAVVERPTILDVAVDADFGALFTPTSEPKSQCECVEIPPDHPETGEAAKQMCTRPGAIGLLSQPQVRDRCSGITPKANGRLQRALALREAQAACGPQVEGIVDKGRKFGARVECLQDYLSHM